MNRARTPAREAETLYASAMNAERRGEYDGALQLYVKAGSAFLALGDRPAATRAVERAEKIKRARAGDVAPVVRDRFSDEEQGRVLRRGRVINGISLPLWGESSSRTGSTEPFTDSEQPALSAEQIAAGVSWRRPEDVFADASVDYVELDPEDIVQRVSDCTLHASVIVCLAHRRRFASKAAIPLLLPSDADGHPRISTNGAYELCIYFNGARRRIAFDSHLPFQPDGVLMCLALSEAHANAIWPSLVEKAYLKLFGGYEFLGSNSAADLHVLLGWIPEHIELKRRTFQREQTWSRLADAFHEGTGLITVGTDDRPPTSIGTFRPLRSHCYAIIGVSAKTEEDRWLTIQDSVERTTATNSDYSVQPHSRTKTIRMSWHDLCTTFDSVYISWDPRMFPRELSYHGVWRPSYMSDADKSESSHQIVHLIVDPLEPESARQSDVWILLTRHRTSTRSTDEYVSLQVELEDFVQPDEAASSTRTKGVYTDSPHVLVRTSAPPRGAILRITTSYDGGQECVGFTLSVFSYAATRWDQALRKLLYDDVMVTGVFNSKTGGGNHTLSTYMYNPQYKLTVPPSRTGSKTRVALAVQTTRELPVNATVVWGKGERIFDLTKSDILASSGAYSYGYAAASKDLSPGTYTVVVSAFEPSHHGSFSLKIASSSKVQLEAIPQEGSGMFAKVTRGEWMTGIQPRYEFTLTAASQVQARLQLQDPSPTTMVCFTLTAIAPQRFSFTSELTDAPAGAGMPRVTLRPGTYTLSLSAEGFGEGVRFRLTVWSDRSSVDLRSVS